MAVPTAAGFDATTGFTKLVSSTVHHTQLLLEAMALVDDTNLNRCIRTVDIAWTKATQIGRNRSLNWLFPTAAGCVADGGRKSHRK
jgi:hypothetical protein